MFVLKSKTISLTIVFLMVVLGLFYGILSSLSLPNSIVSVPTEVLWSKTLEVCTITTINIANEALCIAPFAYISMVLPMVMRPKRVTAALHLILVPIPLALAGSAWIAYCILLKQIDAFQLSHIRIVEINIYTTLTAIAICAVIVASAKQFENQRALALSLLMLQGSYVASLGFTSYMFVRP